MNPSAKQPSSPDIDPALPFANTVDFPCDFLIKVVGYHKPAFLPTICKLLTELDPSLNEGKISSKLSKEGSYQSLTVHFYATSQKQLLEAYLLLKASPDVLWAQ